MKEDKWTWEEYGEPMQQFVEVCRIYRQEKQKHDASIIVTSSSDRAVQEEEICALVAPFIEPIMLPLIDLCISRAGFEPIRIMDNRLAGYIDQSQEEAKEVMALTDMGPEFLLIESNALAFYNAQRLEAGKNSLSVEDLKKSQSHKWLMCDVVDLVKENVSTAGRLGEERTLLLSGESANIEDVAKDPMMQLLFDYVGQQSGVVLVRECSGNSSKLFGDILSGGGELGNALLSSQMKLLMGDPNLTKACALYVAQSREMEN